MDNSSFSVPYSYAISKVDFSWKEILFALNHELLSSYSAVEHAMEELKCADNYPDLLVELASLGENEPVRELVEGLAYLEKDTVLNIEAKWLYVLLSWVYENRSNYDDALQIIEQVYADFGYPKSIESFVRYMPSDEPSLGSVEKDTERLYEKWNSYLVRQSEAYKTQGNVAAYCELKVSESN